MPGAAIFLALLFAAALIPATLAFVVGKSETNLLDSAPVDYSPLGIFALHRGGAIYEKLLLDAGELLPSVIHKSIPLNDSTARVIVVGDVHGCLDELHDLLQKVQYRQDQDVLLFTGDLGNRGPYSVGVIQEIQRLGGHSVRGNNDDASLAAWEAWQKGQEVPQIFRWVKELPEADARWMYELPWSISVPQLNLVVVHGGLVPGVALERQSLHDIYELREIVPAGNGKWRMAGKGLEEGVEWASKWDGPQHVVFGHDAKRGLQKLPLATGLDSGVCYGFRLSALVVQAERHALQAVQGGGDLDMNVVSVEAHRRYA